MRQINELLKEVSLKADRYHKRGNAIFVDTEQGRLVVKNKKSNNEIINYLNARAFNYYPKIINRNDSFEVTEYVDEVEMPTEQKMMEMVDLVSLLHNKTTYFKEADISDFKKTYEDIANNIVYLRGHYDDIMTIIEAKVYMSPSEYLLARNISKIYGAINYASEELEVWYDLVKDKKKQRKVVLHNNLELDHFRKNDHSYLINWDKARIDIPIFDMYKLYLRHVNDFDFEEILNRYEREYLLSEDERKLLFILISLPDKLEWNQNEYNMTRTISKLVNRIYKTESLIAPYYNKDGKTDG